LPVAVLLENAALEVNEQQDFYSISIEEQKLFFVDMAKNLGMDPDDPNSEFGQIVEEV
jgi:hypothetical protein